MLFLELDNVTSGNQHDFFRKLQVAYIMGEDKDEYKVSLKSPW